jgi:hypothetical protein
LRLKSGGRFLPSLTLLAGLAMDPHVVSFPRLAEFLLIQGHERMPEVRL